MSGTDGVSSSLLKTDTNCSFKVFTFMILCEYVMLFFAVSGDTTELSFLLLLMKFHSFFFIF